MRIVAALSLLAIGTICCAQGPAYIGTYDLVRIIKGKPVNNSTLPPGQVMIIELRKNGTFEMRDFLSGFEGTWVANPKSVTLTIKTGPAGKLKKPDILILQPEPDRSRLVVVSPKKAVGQVELHWNPKAIEQWNTRMNEAMKRAKELMKKGSSNHVN